MTLCSMVIFSKSTRLPLLSLNNGVESKTNNILLYGNNFSDLKS